MSCKLHLKRSVQVSLLSWRSAEAVGCGLKGCPRCILAVYAFFVSKIVGPYDQPVREAVDYAERYPSDPNFGRELQRQEGGT